MEDKKGMGVVIAVGKPAGDEGMVSVEQDGYKPQVTVPKMNLKEIPQTEKFYICGIASRVEGGEDEDSITIEFDKMAIKPHNKTEKMEEEEESAPRKSLDQSFDDDYEEMNA